MSSLKRCFSAKLAVFGILGLVCLTAGCTVSPEAKKAKYLSAGKELMAKKSYERAALQFKNAVQVDPKDAEAHYQFALALMALSDWENATRQLLKATELDTKHTKAQLQLSRLMAGTSDLSVIGQANQRLEDLLVNAPEDPEVLVNLAITEWRLSKKEDAEKHLREAFEKFPSYLDSAVRLARLLASQGDLKGAEDTLKKAAAQQPPSAGALAALGAFYASQNRLGEAEAQFRRAVELDQKNGPALHSLAALNVRAGRMEDADRLYKRLSQLSDAKYTPIYGAFLLETGKTAEALEEFGRLAKSAPEDREARSRLVSALFSANRQKEATDILDKALKRNARDVPALLQRSRLEMNAGHYDQAQRDLDQVIHFRSDSAEGHYLSSRVYQARGLPLLQRQELDETLRLRPDLISARIDMVNLLILSNSAKTALAVINEAPAEQRSMPVLLTAKNSALIALGELGQARQGIDEALRNGKTVDLLRQDAMLKLRAKSYEEARKSVREALAMAPGDDGSLRLLVRTYVDQKQVPAALKEVSQLASQNRNVAPLQKFLGELLLETGDTNQARKAYSSAATAAPAYLDAEVSLAKLDIMEGKLDEAKKRLNSLADAAPQRALPRLWLGHVEEMKGNHAAAIEQYRKAVEFDGNNVQALNNLAYLLTDYSQRPDDALKFAEKALEIDPTNPDNQDTLGWVLYQKGLYPAAVQQLRAAADKTKRPVVFYHLAMAYSKAGDSKRAHTELEAAIKMNPRLPEAERAKQVVNATP
jgi:tetratricopeptide (TPR) repeat protein